MRPIKNQIFVMVAMVLMIALVPQPLIARDTSSNGLKLEKAAICRGVVDRTPIGAGSVFPSSIERLYCFTRVVGAETDTAIVHNWYLNGKLNASVALPVKSASWRTWSSKKIDPDDSGDWMVEVVTEDGEALESILFFVQ